ncbi:hypothetical protein [Stappia sp. ES.058]|uniref:DUF6916 family protein n=1 Tax=Stappia sp. ES.058 TaxID=1881061 RepID=UPI00087CA67D|nr:hypothetical protein [Stappia sp. ES.058]SDU48320.1 hypothetical protein SAMN05428979_4260 [Stappia sp. ES.058]
MTGPIDLSTATMADFEACRDKPIRLTCDGESMSLTIAEIAPVSGPEREGGAFSVVFKGPAEPVVEQAIHQIEIEGAGETALFIVPLGPDGEGMLYEAVFN